MIRAIAALALAVAPAHAATSSSSETLNSTAPWWEKVTVTITGDGQPQGCRFESSSGTASAKDCEVVGSQAGTGASSGSKDQYTRITFERRFSPDATRDLLEVGAGDTLLGRQVMALAIDGNGAVKDCKVVVRSGDMTPEYGCKEAVAEKFEASARSGDASLKAGFMTILVYGHAEHVV